jgi:hypothetical protein
LCDVSQSFLKHLSLGKSLAALVDGEYLADCGLDASLESATAWKRRNVLRVRDVDRSV